ncbi:MAG: hypothetical protein CMO55_19630 [Verrucomicrobiales bacterium]|nr:hypothetical protein [Verrucomicrobiales bacterium]
MGSRIDQFRPFLKSIFVNRPSRNFMEQGALREWSLLHDRNGTQFLEIPTGLQKITSAASNLSIPK